MSKQLLQPYKGARDFYPEDKCLQKWMFTKWRRVVERYGYEEYDAPILEPTELYLMKGNQEIVDEQTYTFKDRGDRSVTVRTEMTPSVSRMIASRRQELSYPVRWYSIPNLWRYERMQRGRLREFWQLNVDLFGVSSMQAEIEMLRIVDDLFQAFKAKRTSYQIKLNSRQLVNAMFIEAFGFNDTQITTMVRLIDRMAKIGADEFLARMTEITQNDTTSAQIVALLQVKSLEQLPDSLRQLKPVQDLQQIMTSLTAQGVSNIEFDITLMRGFDYYTDVVFEVFDTDPENNRSMFGGGRYDGLIGEFGVEPVPTVGFGMGDVTFMNFLETHKLIPEMKQSVDAVVIVRDNTEMDTLQSVVDDIREMGANIAVDYSERKVDKQFKSAMKSGARYAIFIGPEEQQREQYILKDLKTGKEEKHSPQRIVSIIKDSRKK